MFIQESWIMSGQVFPPAVLAVDLEGFTGYNQG